MGKLNCCGYVILRFYPTREMCKNLMHAKNVLQYTTAVNGCEHCKHCSSQALCSAVRNIHYLLLHYLYCNEGICFVQCC